jgi:hypothetical protein
MNRFFTTFLVLIIIYSYYSLDWLSYLLCLIPLNSSILNADIFQMLLSCFLILNRPKYFYFWKALMRSKMSTMVWKLIAGAPTPKPHWDSGATHGRRKLPTRLKSSIPWSPSPWKASPQHVMLRKLEGCRHCCSCHCWLPTCLWDILQTKQVSTTHQPEFPQPPLG